MQKPDGLPLLPRTDQEKAAHGLVLDVCLAEFKDLRAELVSRVQSQFVFITTNATVAALIGGLVVRGGVGQRGLLLLLPLLGSTLYFMFIDHAVLIMLLSSYMKARLAHRIRLTIRLALSYPGSYPGLLGWEDPGLLGWEDYLARERGRNYGALSMTVVIAAFVAFAAPTVLALVSLVADRPPVPGGVEFWVLWGLGSGLFLTAVAAQITQVIQQLRLDREYKETAAGKDVGFGFDTLPLVLARGLRKIVRGWGRRE